MEQLKAHQLAEKLNRNRAARGEAPVNARVECGCVVIDPQFVAPPQAILVQLNAQCRRRTERAAAQVARSKDRILSAFEHTEGVLTVREISSVTGLNEMTVRSHLPDLVREGSLMRGPDVLRAPARRYAMSFAASREAQP